MCLASFRVWTAYLKNMAESVAMSVVAAWEAAVI
jgi:hypothetical protein